MLVAPVSVGIGWGFTVMVKVFAGPAHPTEPLVNVGVTAIVATTGTVPVFVAVKEEIFPVPEPANPMPGVSLVQE